jgi:glycosyltransferase involved in cell wall biosynthesis
MPNDDDNHGEVRASVIGFACAWEANQRETWSGTPFRLREALAASGPVTNLGAGLPKPVQLALKAAFARRSDGRWVSMWKHRSVTRRLTERRLVGGFNRGACEAAVTVQDLGVLPVPYLIVQDLSYDALLDHYGRTGVPHFPSLRRDALERMRDRQNRVYEGAAALLPMSGWLAERLAASGVDRSKIFPIHPGVNVPVPGDHPVPERRMGAAQRLLFIGRDPHTKALDLVVEAFLGLRREFGPVITLTVAGPRIWPLPGPVPDGVNFLGPVDRDRVARLMDTHDLFVMPSRLEGFGIAFVEALSRGLPCIGRNAFAMPEIILPGIGGTLIDDDDAERLGAAIVEALGDDELYRRCAADVARVRRHYTWARAAREVRAAVSAVTT